jgi:hypothetical protein
MMKVKVAVIVGLVVDAGMLTAATWEGEGVVYEGDFYEEPTAACESPDGGADLWQGYVVEWEPVALLEPMDPTAFEREWMAHGHPVVIRGAALDWPAVQLWTLGSLRAR